ncbi:hypothetical protein SAMN05660473_02133 [Arthrobacter sp. 49Tsu3.1M3]|uniref:plasmid mobilization protein n=1 Tax=Arthrobacter sp. 49Tsu3.1M3 TaxID=1279029 RepID=UPI0009C883B6|nr:hypothetical protein [Arthrobacter sp. 49Tsu3.1M3]SKB73465.1 hypothetical protein SAMN05660473_02133 [Arthrobacter sp. 49Tsu3.1M3]
MTGSRLEAMLLIEKHAALLRRQFSEPSSAAPADPEADAPSPSPAGSAATEDEGEGFLSDMSASEMSDKNPAGLHPLSLPRRHSRTSNETTRERRQVSLDVRLTETEREAIRLRAHVLGVKPSAWVRGVVLDALDARRDEVSRMHLAAQGSPQPELVTAVEQLRRVGQNLNQALRAVHSGDAPAVDEGLLREVQVSVDEVRASLGDRTAS